MLIVERPGERKFRRGAPGHFILQRSELLFPLGSALAYFQHGECSQRRAIVGELYDFDRTGNVLPGGIACESGEADALHSDEQAGGSQGCRAVNETSAGELVHRDRSVKNYFVAVMCGGGMSGSRFASP